MRGKQIVRWAGALAGACSLAACGGQPTACTAIGLQPNGVTIQVPGLPLGSRVTGEVCTPSKCTTATEKYVDQFFLFVSNPGIASTAPLAITVTVRDPAGKELVPKKSLVVTPVRNQPNGAGCEPIGYFATAVVALAPAARKGK